MLAGDMLPTVTADDQRSRISDSACSIEHVILSIHTFLEDTKYHEPPATTGYVQRLHVSTFQRPPQRTDEGEEANE